MTAHSPTIHSAIQNNDKLQACRLKADLGECHALGKSVPIDETYAAKLYRLAAIQGNVQAICNLSVCYFTGTGVLRDHEQGLRLLKIT